LANETILVVDDGKENRDFLVEYVLQPNGYKALLARDGRDGAEMALEHRPDLILLDLQMPRMDGFEVIRFLANHHVDIPIILMTFHGSEEIAVEVYRMGVRDYVKKPYSVDEMLLAIDRSLTEVRLRKEKEALTERVIQANRELQRRVNELNVLHSIGKDVTKLLSSAELLPRIVDAAVQITQAEEGYIYLIEDNRLMRRAHKLANSGPARPANLETRDRALYHVIKEQHPVVMKPEHLAREGSKLVSAAYAPIMLRGDVIGVLGVGSVTPNAHIFTKHDGALLSMVTDYVAISIENARNYEALRQAKERVTQQLRVTMERFVPPSVVDRVLSNPSDLKLGGTRQEISVLFADIRGYTAWSENAPPEKVVEMLNDYLSLGAEIVLGWDGTLDKFFGDGLMAIFNAPKFQEDHVHRAADTALALMRASEEMRRQRGDKLMYSIGVHVGEAVVGYIGTDRALNYTAIGDVVNVAKRLQEHAQPGQILVEESVIQRLGDLVEAQPLGAIQIRNRKQPIYPYNLVGLKPRG
jgi:class 3 adenylate cyclase/DNA-binding response OmpR family regulator